MSLVTTIQLLIKEKRLPWFVVCRIKKLKNSLFYVANRLNHLTRFKQKDQRKLITYVCGFHGETGGAIAAASIANLLAKTYRVEFVTFPTSDMNHLLSKEVKVVKEADFASAVFIADAECEHAFYQKVKELQKKLIISCHCLPDQSHGLEPEYILTSLSYASSVHFVSEFQRGAFQLDDIPCHVIPNTTKAIVKTQQTNNVGSVGNLSNKEKNVEKSIKIALQSNADTIQLWSVKKDLWNNDRVIAHDWETNKVKIYNSFDVLVFMSQLETFGLVVIEAMSAGVPCVLSNIPAFQQFKDCPGIVIIGEDEDHTCRLLNELLIDKERLAVEMKRYFQRHYSTEAITKQWENLIEQTTA